MQTSTLKRLNRLLADYLNGLSLEPDKDPRYPQGQDFRRRATSNGADQTYKWVRSRELTAHILNPNTGFFEAMPQIPEDRWTLAMWQAPPSKELWDAEFQGQIPYPRGGYYVAVDTPCDPLFEMGVEPNERMTMYIIGLRKKEIAMGLRGLRDSIREAQKYREQQNDKMLDDYLTDKFTSFAEVPGACGGTWFGVPGQKESATEVTQ